MIEEWRELTKLVNTYLGPLPALTRRGRPPAHDDQPDGRVDGPALDDEPEPAVDPDPHRARPRDPVGVRRRRGPPAALGRLQPGRAAILAHVSGEPKLREAFARGEDIHRATAAEVLRRPGELTKDERTIAKMVNFGIIYGISAFGLSENLEIPREEAQAYIDTYLARFPHVQDFIQRTIEQATRDGYARRCSAAAGPCRRSGRRTGRRARSASGSRSTR